MSLRFAKSEIQMKDANIWKNTVSHGGDSRSPSLCIVPLSTCTLWLPPVNKESCLIGGRQKGNWGEPTSVQSWEGSCNLVPKWQVWFGGTGDAGLMPSYLVTWLRKFLPRLAWQQKTGAGYVPCLSGQTLRPPCRVSRGPRVARFSVLKRIVGRAEGEWM